MRGVAREEGEISQIEELKGPKKECIAELKEDMIQELDAKQGNRIEVVKKNIKKEVREENAKEDVIRVQDTGRGEATLCMSAIEDIKASLGLMSFSGDPCLPVGHGYSWLKCSGGEIPEAINSLPTLTEIHFYGNNVEGQISDLGSLLNLEALYVGYFLVEKGAISATTNSVVLFLIPWHH
ncbi:hypothetical protein L7F22_003454 [Adiantum nelumboides]|nr:hypothetical protein [Adiantum nelumboides]